MDTKAPDDPRVAAIPDSHGHAKGEHKPFGEERPIPYTARMLFLWFYHACRRGSPRFMMVADHMNYLTFEDPAAVNLVRRALKLAQAGDLYGAAETAGVEVGHAAVVSEGLRRGMRYAIGAEVDNDPRSRPDAQNIVDAMRPDGTVRSVHFLSITHPTHGENWMWPFDNPEFKDLYDVIGTERVWELYMATLLEAVEKLPGNIVGHFYVPAVFGHWPDDATLERYEDQLIDACAERGMAIELNSRYIYRHFRDEPAQLAKFRDVHLRLLRKAVAKNVAIAVGSDAHSPKDQGGGFEAVLAMLDEAEINEIAFPLGGRLARVALRATEEILRQYAPEPEPEPAPPPLPEPVVESVAQPKPVPATTAAPVRKRPSRAKPKAAAAAQTPDVAERTAVIADEPPTLTPAAKTETPRLKRAEKTIAAATKSKPESKAVAQKAVPAPKPAAKKAAAAAAPAKKAVVSKKPVAAKKSIAAAKAGAKKVAAKKTAAKSVKAVPAKKTAAKKVAASKSVVRKGAARKAAAKKAGPKKKTALAKKSVARKVVKKSAKKPAARAAKRAPVRRPASKKSAKRPAGRSRR